MPPTRYGWKDDYVLFALVTKTGDLNSYREAIEADNSDKWITGVQRLSRVRVDSAESSPDW